MLDEAKICVTLEVSVDESGAVNDFKEVVKRIISEADESDSKMILVFLDPPVSQSCCKPL